jgi:nucleotide-binding universal stress UspA family protein
MKFSHIIAGTDFSKTSAWALPYVKTLSEIRKTTVWVVHVLEPVWVPYHAAGEAVATMDIFQKAAAQQMERFVREHELKKWPVPVKTDVVTGPPAAMMAKMAQSKKSSLIALTVRGASPMARIIGLGGTAGQTVAQARRPVLLVNAAPPRGEVKFKVVMCPTDFSSTANKAFRCAVTMARRFGAKLEMVHVPHRYNYQKARDHSLAWAIKQFEAYLRKSGRDLMETMQRTTGPIAANSSIVEAPSVHEGIVRHAKACKADLIVMGTRGEGLKKELLGSNTERVAWQSPCPVLSIPG